MPLRPVRQNSRVHFRRVRDDLDIAPAGGYEPGVKALRIVDAVLHLPQAVAGVNEKGKKGVPVLKGIDLHTESIAGRQEDVQSLRSGQNDE